MDSLRTIPRCPARACSVAGSWAPCHPPAACEVSSVSLKVKKLLPKRFDFYVNKHARHAWARTEVWVELIEFSKFKAISQFCDCRFSDSDSNPFCFQRWLILLMRRTWLNEDIGNKATRLASNFSLFIQVNLFLLVPARRRSIKAVMTVLMKMQLLIQAWSRDSSWHWTRSVTFSESILSESIIP